MNETVKSNSDTINMSEPMRLQKFLAACGIASRRKCETLITEGHVSVNGQVVTVLGTKVSANDEVFVDGVRLSRKFVSC